MELTFIPEGLNTATAVFLLLSSVITSMITASLGAGGGVLLLVLMAFWIPPAAIIPVHGMIQLGSNAGRATLTWQHTDWKAIAAFAPGVLVGAGLGAWLLIDLPPYLWQLTIGAFVLYLCWGPALPKGAFGSIGIFLASALTSFISLFCGARPVGVFSFGAKMKSLFLISTASDLRASLKKRPRPFAFAQMAGCPERRPVRRSYWRLQALVRRSAWPRT